jgi:hypothetical protein
MTNLIHEIEHLNKRISAKELKDKDGKVRPKFIDGLKKDFEYLTALNTRWQAIEENNDPKWDVFVEL